MTRSEKITYLANILAVALADQQISRPETMAMRDVLGRLGAGDDLLQAARDLLDREGAYALTPLADPADGMRNIEDMVLLALADGALQPDESALIEGFLSDLGFAQADMDMIVRRTQTRLRDLGLAVTVGGATRRERARVAEAKRNPPPPPPPPPPPLPSRHAAPVPEVSRALPVAATVAPVPAVPAASPVIPPSGLPEKLAACVQRRAQAPEGACYCFGLPDRPLNPWACRLLDMDWTPGAAWLRLGRFRDDETFVFDGDAIRAGLQERLAGVAACPYLLAGWAMRACASLPSRASTAGRWRHRVAPAGASGAVTVSVRTYRHGCARSETLTADGLEPTDGRDAWRMIRRAAQQAVTAADLKRLQSYGGQP
jgi:hypothetical protein